MTIKEYISKIETLNDDAVIYAKRIDGKFSSESEAVVLELTEEELGMKTDEIAKNKCPGYDYFLEVFLIKEIWEGYSENEPTADLTKITDRIVYYAEYDA